MVLNRNLVNYIFLLMLFYPLSVLAEIPEVVSGESDKALTALTIMKSVDQRYQGDTRQQKGTLTLVDKKKSQRVRGFVEFAKKYGDDEKTISHILSPAEVRGTAFMSYQWQVRSREDESWLYLPQLKKVRRLASADNSGYFLGSDFTYADLIGLEVDDFDYTFVEAVNKVDKQGDYWIIEALPKPSIQQQVIDETGYIKVKYWIDKEKLMTVKAQYWLNEGSKIKYLTVSDFKKIDDIWTAKKQQMVLTQGGKMLHASIYQLSEVSYNIPLEDEAFTTYAMARELR